MKRIISVISCILLLVMSGGNDVFASTPLSLALELEEKSMGKGDTTQVMVSLQNYNENYTDNVITTMIIEVSVDTSKLDVDKNSITMKMDTGKGMGFGVAQLKKDKVELQYLNVADPLKKGTKELYCFDVTAKEEVDNLLNALNITYVVVQDGTLAVSEKLQVVPIALVNGEAVELETEVETETASEQKESETNNGNGAVQGETTTTGKTNDTNASGNAEESTTKKNASESGTTNEESDTKAEKPTGTGSDEPAEGESGDGEKPSAESEINNSDDKKNDSDTESKGDVKDSAESDDKAADEDTKRNEKNNTGKFILLGAAIIIGAAGGVGFYFYKKKKSAGTQK